MKYGKLFKKYFAKYGQVELSSNRCSGLTRKELMAMAKAMYPEQKKTLARYMNKSTEDLGKAVYSALKSL